ncbi:exonuclease V [Apiosordaria backusii]|uniref:Exonuclease V n=1 Tax=Apiosordaria backusii TaxID=314023 RepID=A0AA40B2C1_9PEZI|nr:exonuclease V [Apiosordaria backusii]
MSSFKSFSDSDSDYGYNLSPEEEALLVSICDRLSPAPTSAPTALPKKNAQAPPIPAPHTSRPPPSPPKPITSSKAPSSWKPPVPEVVSVFRPPAIPSSSRQNKPKPSQLVPPRWDIGFDPDASQAVEETLEGLSENDLNFDISQLTPDQEPTHRNGSSNIEPVGKKNRGGYEEKRPSVPAAPRIMGSHVSFDTKSESTYVSTMVTAPDTPRLVVSQALAGVTDTDLSVLDEDPQKALEEEIKKRNGVVPSPLEHFRTFPRKPLSVTDLTAGLWCELQHYYTLSRLPFGRKIPTAAMKKGTKVHEKLEREIFHPVTVTVAKKVDTLGLQMWNVILSLRTLRDAGFTRELHVWGMVDGNLVNGVIDYLSYENPDSELEEETLSSRGSQNTASQRYADARMQVFITDVKTRLTPKPPSKPQVHMSLIQLFLYHRFLSEMASDKLDYFQIFARYNLDPDDLFSDSFMAQMAALHEEIFDTQEDSETETETERASEWGLAPGQQAQTKGLKYSTLRSLLGLLKFELQLTFPHGASDIGQIVAVEYRYRGEDESLNPDTIDEDIDEAEARDREEGRVISTTTYFVEPETLDMYLAQTMPWWKGEREPRGVELEDAFKCGYCDFAGECEWRAKMDDEVVRKARASRARRERKRMKAEGAVVTGDGLEGEQGQKPVLEEYSGDVEEETKTPKRTTKGKKRGARRVGRRGGAGRSPAGVGRGLFGDDNPNPT